MSSTAEAIPEEQTPVAQTAGADAPPDEDLPETVIERRPGWRLLDLRELWRFRELLFFLAWRDVKVRYKQTVLGTAWAFLQPLATMIVFAFFLGRMGGVSEGMANYPLFVFAGVLPWTFFANAVTAAGNSIVSNQNLVSKVYFPRLAMPISAVGACLFDFLIALLLLAGMSVWYGSMPGWEILLAPVIMLLLTATAVGVGTLLAALIVAHRDFRYVMTFAVQLWMFATPCIYLKPTDIGPNAHLVLPLNPAYGLLLNFRQAVMGGELDWYALGVSSAVGLLCLVGGLLYFRRVEANFADVI
jgi:lipopolysaccharide transport system permease protein